MTTIVFPPQCLTEVKCLGEPLDHILWQRSQWAVTDYGIERRNGRYAIYAIHFVDSGRGLSPEVYLPPKEFWVQHMGRKNWVDIDDFEDAVEVFMLLFDRKGRRNQIEAPRLESLCDVEQLALEAGDRAYQAAKKRLIK